MFNSIGNNFGAGQITFKDYQAENYVVLNSKFSFDPTNTDYQACDQLEIYVPDLTIDRSAWSGVFIRFVEDYHYAWGDSVYDGGTVLKSWIKDKNTIFIEKQPWFDENGPLIIYIVTLYPQLNQGWNTIKSTMQRLTMTTEGNYLRFDYETFMCEFKHWVFIHLKLSGVTYAYRKALWEVTMEQLPADITADVPICGGGNQMHPNCDGMAEAHIENKVLTSQRRVMGFFDTAYDPFVYAFLVRDNNDNTSE